MRQNYFIGTEIQVIRDNNYSFNAFYVLTHINVRLNTCANLVMH